MSENAPETMGVIYRLQIKDLHPHPQNPFAVRDDPEMLALKDSVSKHGVLVPAIARPRSEGGYELIAGHRRKHASKLAGIDFMPVIVMDLNDDEAIIQLVDSNIQRENILPSERAKAYKMKLDALTELIPEILKMVDDGKIALTPAVELSYLTKQEQQNLLETMESEDCTPSLSQAIQMKKLSQLGFLDMDKIFAILREPKANQQDKISFRVDDLRKYFPKSYSAARIQAHIIKLLDADLRKRQRDLSR